MLSRRREGGKRNGPHCHQKTGNGTHERPTHSYNPLLPCVLPKVMPIPISPPRVPLVKAEECTVEKPLILQEKPLRFPQKVQKVPVGVPTMLATCCFFHLSLSPNGAPPCATLTLLHSHRYHQSGGVLFMKLLPATPVLTDKCDSWASLVNWAAAQSGHRRHTRNWCLLCTLI